MLASRFGVLIRNSKWNQHVRLFQPRRALPPDEPQVLDHIGPLQVMTPLLQPRLRLLAQHQRQERAEDMTPDRLVTLVVDRPGLQERLARPGPVLHHPQPLELQRHRGRIQIDVGAEHPLAVVAGLLGELRLVDLEMVGTRAAQVAAVAPVADQRLVPTAELLPQGGHDRLPIGGILAGLILITADDILTWPQRESCWSPFWHRSILDVLVLDVAGDSRGEVRQSLPETARVPLQLLASLRQ